MLNYRMKDVHHETNAIMLMVLVLPLGEETSITYGPILGVSRIVVESGH